MAERETAADPRPEAGASPDADYLLGDRDEELQRLAFQHRIWARQAFELWERVGFGYGQTLLDLGCGPGLTSLDLAHLVGPAGRVIAVDSSAPFLARLESQATAQGIANIEPVEADAQQLELTAASLDGAYARWLLCFVPDPEEVVRRVAAALKPGAPFATTDYFNYRAFTMAPRSAAFDRVVAAVEESWRRQGGDLGVQGRMPGLMRRAGLEVTTVRSSCRVARPGSPLWSWPETFFSVFLPTLLQMRLLTEDDAEAFRQLWRARAADPDAFLAIPPMYDVVGVKAA